MSNEIPQGTPYAPAPPNSNMAIVSLVAGILGLTFFPFLGSIAAVITGYMARKEIEQSMGALSGTGLATAGLVLGWIGIALGVLGLCVGGAFIIIPLCLLALGLSVKGSSLLIPALIALL
jgi:hypothetical protein